MGIIGATLPCSTFVKKKKKMEREKINSKFYFLIAANFTVNLTVIRFSKLIQQLVFVNVVKSTNYDLRLERPFCLPVRGSL